MKRSDLGEHEIKFPSLSKEKFSATWDGIDLQSDEGKQSFKDGDPEFFTGSGKRPLSMIEKGIIRNAEKVIEMVQDQNYTNAKHIVDNDLAMNAEWMVKAIKELEAIRRGGGPRSKFVKRNPWLMDM